MSQKPIDVIEITDSPPKKKNKKASRSVLFFLEGGGGGGRGRGQSYEVMDRQFSDQIMRKCQINTFSVGNHMACNLEQIYTRRFFKY